MEFLINPALSLLGVIIGIIFGAIPGMTATMAVAVFLPMTYGMALIPSLYLLLGLYVGGISGGLIPAILINIPGTPSSVCTGFDGYPMARRGEGERALKIGITASLFGGLISLAVLALLTPPLARVAIKFSAIEKFLIIFFALTVIASLSKGGIVKGVFAGFVGILLSMVGVFSTNNGVRLIPPFFEKGSFMFRSLRTGFQLLPVLIGLFAIAQMFSEAEKGMKSNNLNEGAEVGNAQKFSFGDFKGQAVNVIRSSLLGTFMGILPGVGGSAASLIAYSQTKTWSKHPELLGTGAAEGLISSESSNNGLTGGALVPLLSLGIPGDSTTAVLIGAFMLNGVQAGPLFISQNPDIWNTILVALLLCNFLMFAVMFFPIKQITKIVNIPTSRLYPVILMMCIVGAYTNRSGNMFDVWGLLIFGILAFIFSKVGLPNTPFLIGFILGGDLEKYLTEALMGNNGDLLCFFSRPIGNVIWVLIVVFLAYTVWDNLKGHTMEKNGMKS